MKKRFGFFTAIIMIVTLCLSLAVGCGEKDPDPKPKDEPIYVGLFTYTRTMEGAATTQNFLNLKEDGTFYLDSGFTVKGEVGTYSYNADKTKITINATIEQNYSGTYDVEVNEDGLVVLKNVKTFAWEGTWYTDDYIYDAVSPKPIEEAIEINKFLIQSDKDASLTFLTGNRYELAVSNPEILSSGTYTQSKSGNTTTYTLTDTSGLIEGGATFTFTCTYTEEDGYSNLILKGTGIAAEGIEFVYEISKTVQSVFSGTTSHGEGDAATTETVTLTNYEDGTFEIEFTTYGAYPATATGTWKLNATTYTPEFTVTDGVGKDYVTALTATMDPQTYATTISVTIKNEQAYLEYTVTLTMAAAEKEVLAEGTGTVDTNFYGNAATETVTIKYFADNEFELEFTTMGAYPAVVGGTYSEDYGAKTITYTVTSGEGKDCVTAISGIFNDSWVTVISVTITTQAGAYDVEITITPKA